jgi:metalloendopeptidase OMA1, mitochondrial
VPHALSRAFRPAGRPSIQQQHRYFHPTPSCPAKFPRKPSYNRFSRVEQAKYLWFNSPIFRYGVIAVGIGGSIFYFANIEEVPITHRRRFNCMPEGWGDDMGNTLQQQILSQYRGKVLPTSDNRVLLVAKVLNRLIPHSGLLNLEWEVHVIDEPKIMNAFVIPGYESTCMDMCRARY